MPEGSSTEETGFTPQESHKPATGGVDIRDATGENVPSETASADESSQNNEEMPSPSLGVDSGDGNQAGAQLGKNIGKAVSAAVGIGVKMAAKGIDMAVTTIGDALTGGGVTLFKQAKGMKNRIRGVLCRGMKEQQASDTKNTDVDFSSPETPAAASEGVPVANVMSSKSSLKSTMTPGPSM